MAQGLSRYQQFLMDTSPVADEYGIAKGIVQPKVNPTVIRNPNPSLQTVLKRNIGTTGKGVMSGLKATGGTTAKLAGKTAPGIGAAVTGYDAFRSFQIADEMDKINKLQPGSFPQEAIDFYRNKGRAITTGAGVGAGTGGVLGAGVFSLPGALIGTGIGGTVGGLGYEFAQRKNPFANYQITPEQYALLYGKNSNDTVKTTNGAQSTNGSKVSGKGTTQSQAQAISNQLLSGQPTKQSTEQASEQANIQAINDYIQQLKDINQPYVEALQNYLNNYQDLYNKQQMSARRLRDMSLITGNPLWYQSAKDYNPLVAEANRINTIKTLQDAQAGDLNAINEIMGNLAVANDMGISPEAAFANKNLLTALMQNKRIASDWDRAQLADATRRYGIDQRVANALAVQGLRNQGALERAYLNYMAFGGGVPGVAPGLNRQGGAQAPYQPLANKPQSQEAALFQQVTGH